MRERRRRERERGRRRGYISEQWPVRRKRKIARCAGAVCVGSKEKEIEQFK